MCSLLSRSSGDPHCSGHLVPSFPCAFSSPDSWLGKNSIKCSKICSMTLVLIGWMLSCAAGLVSVTISHISSLVDDISSATTACWGWRFLGCTCATSSSIRDSKTLDCNCTGPRLVMDIRFTRSSEFSSARGESSSLERMVVDATKGPLLSTSLQDRCCIIGIVVSTGLTVSGSNSISSLVWVQRMSGLRSFCAVWMVKNVSGSSIVTWTICATGRCGTGVTAGVLLHHGLPGHMGLPWFSRAPNGV